MKRLFRTLLVSCVAVGALTAVAAASASAAPHFSATQLGALTGTQTSSQVFNTGAGEVVCTTAATKGEIVAAESPEQKVTVNYSGCKAFSIASVTISAAEYDLHANGTVDILNTIKINVPLAGCSVSVPPQSGLSSVSYANKSPKIEQSSAVKGISSTGTGGLCGGANTAGTYTGSNLVGGPGVIEWHAS